MAERIGNPARVAFIGFGEAGQAFAGSLDHAAHAFAAFDRKTGDPATAAAKRADYGRCGVAGCDTPAAALAEAGAVLSLVTADQVLAAARACAPDLAPGTYWFEMNSVAPGTKREVAAVLAASGASFVDVAIMAPVDPKRSGVPLLASGPHAEDGAALLRALGFADVRAVAGDLGAASAIKMIRSVMVKGIEALTAECMLAAHEAGVADAVIASLDASATPRAWGAQADYNLDRMLVHGLRRAAEMEEVVKTLDALGTGSVMTQGTVARQRALGALGLADPPATLAAKVAAILSPDRADAA